MFDTKINTQHGTMDQLVHPWAFSTTEVISRLETTQTGITNEEAKVRLKKYGSNTFHTKEKVNVVSLLLKQFLSPLIFLLLGATILTGILAEWIDMSVILFAVLLNVALGFYHEYHAENTLDKLTTYIKDRTKVIRAGIEQEIDSSLLVPGDIIKLAYGSRVPADARILSANDFSVDEAVLTGESLPVSKNSEEVPTTTLVAERENIAHAGTLVVQGYATGVVHTTGNETEIGKIADIVSETKRVKTPLQKSVGNLAWFIFSVVVFIVLGILFLGISRGELLIPMLVLSAAVAVGAVPEALPIALTVILAIGAERIAEKKGIVRKLTAAETLGSTTLIMTDKTGTLTLADMQLVGINTTRDILSNSSKEQDEQEITSEHKFLLGLSMSNVDVSVENPDQDQDKWIFQGRPFEVNIAKACQLHGVSIDRLASLSSSIVLPFNSTNKFSVSEQDDNYVIMGAPDVLLARSKLSREEYLQIESWIEETSREGKRLVSIATVPKANKDKFNMEDISQIQFLGIFSFYDPVRKEVPDAIKHIESHGVKMVLVTGDLAGTALAVAKSLDWSVSEDEVLTGAQIQNFSDERMLDIMPQIKIFARVTPEDKLRIGDLYQKLGEVVAMTGDGVNDAPALKAMNIGISLGSGSDVAKSASDLVLLDDNFKTISLAIDEGRRILSNIRKTFAYFMSNASNEVFVVGGSLIFGLALPLTALQIIWVNLLTDSLPALAFAFDENFDKEKKITKKAHVIFTNHVKVFSFGIGTLSSVLLFLLYYLLLKFGVEVGLARSIFFVCFSSYVLAIAFSFRSLRHSIFSYSIFSNKPLNIGVLIGAVILILTMTIPFLRGILELEPLPMLWLPFILFWIVFNVLIVEGTKYLMHRFR